MSSNLTRGTKRHYKIWTDEDLIFAVEFSYTLAQVIRNLGLIPAGGNYHSVKQAITRLNLDTSHFTGQASNLGRTFKVEVQPKQLRSRLIRERGHRCEKCDLEWWQGQLIPLELEHIDGDRSNNELDNLLLLCCNCHALTPTWRRAKHLLG